ncbi:uncharacterized protein LOC122669729 [Telopea speciosissima]|uniref:uncharacterized protein LOC122669729 n=1 Tax=Telopea speciosissima TaxID=54955 RepID=UPI001CC40870|nr:uncharacterized protein LOC122669729 [Telopea speciosissima]
MENFDTEVNDSAHELNVMREEGRGVYRRSIDDGDAGEGVGSGFNAIDSSPVFLFGNLLNDLSLCEKEMEGDFGVSNPIQSGDIVEVGCSKSVAHGDFTNSKSQLRHSKVKQLQRRLQILEEDTEATKNEFFACVDECNQLLNEVTQKFYTVHQYLRSPMIGEECVEGALILGTDKGKTMRTGLLQVLYQEPNPSLVTRIHKADIFTLQGPPGGMQKLLNQ